MPRRLSLTQIPGVSGPASPSVASSRPRGTAFASTTAAQHITYAPVTDAWSLRKKPGIDEASDEVDGNHQVEGQTARNVAIDSGPADTDADAAASQIDAEGVISAAVQAAHTNGDAVGSTPKPTLTAEQVLDPTIMEWHYKDPSGNLQGCDACPVYFQLSSRNRPFFWFNHGQLACRRLLPTRATNETS